MDTFGDSSVLFVGGITFLDPMVNKCFFDLNFLLKEHMFNLTEW